MKNLINCPFIPIAKRAASHRGAQGVMYGDQIRERYGHCDVNYGGELTEVGGYDALWVYHGNDWSGGLNMFGGVYGFPYVRNTVNFSKFKGKVYSIGIDFPPYHQMVREKLRRADEKGKSIQPEWMEVDLENLERMHLEAETIKYPHPTRKLVVGDSHAISMYRPGWTVNSVPYKTLNGALKQGLSSFIDIEVDEVEFYFGNIDIRHHVIRLGQDPEQLAQRYIEEVKKVSLPAKIYELLPIENESRKIPQYGYYKGQPFYGTWQERTDARNRFNDYIDKHYGITRWTDHLYNKEGELSFDVMEKPKSIHLSREFYPYWNGMDKASLEDFLG